MAAPRASRDQTNCLHICVPVSCTAKIYCTFEQQTVTCEETHARNADTTQTAGTHDTTDSRAPKNVTSVRTLQQRTYRRTEGIVRSVQERPCSMTTYDSHVIGSEAPLTNHIHTKQRTYSNNTPHHEDLVAVRTSQSSHGIVCEMVQQCRMHVAVRSCLTCVELRNMH